MKTDDLLQSYVVDQRWSHGTTRYDWAREEDYFEFNFWHEEYYTGGWSYKRQEKQRKKFTAWKKANPDWQEKLEKIMERRRVEIEESRKLKAKIAIEESRKQHEKDLKDAQRKAARAERSKKTITAVVKYTKWLAYVLLGAAALGVAYLIFEGVILLFHWIDSVNWEAVGHILWIALEIMVLAIAAGFLIYFIVKLIRKCSISFGDFPMGKAIGKFFSWIGNIIGDWLDNKAFPALGKFFSGVGSVFKFIGMYLKAAKQDYCPGINWVDESKKQN